MGPLPNGHGKLLINGGGPNWDDPPSSGFSFHAVILLMAEILHQFIGIFPIIYRVSYIPGGARFQPSTVAHIGVLRRKGIVGCMPAVCRQLCQTI